MLYTQPGSYPIPLIVIVPRNYIRLRRVIKNVPLCICLELLTKLLDFWNKSLLVGRGSELLYHSNNHQLVLHLHLFSKKPISKFLLWCQWPLKGSVKVLQLRMWRCSTSSSEGSLQLPLISEALPWKKEIYIVQKGKHKFVKQRQFEIDFLILAHLHSSILHTKTYLKSL